MRSGADLVQVQWGPARSGRWRVLVVEQWLSASACRLREQAGSTSVRRRQSGIGGSPILQAHPPVRRLGSVVRPGRCQQCSHSLTRAHPGQGHPGVAGTRPRRDAGHVSSRRSHGPGVPVLALLSARYPRRDPATPRRHPPGTITARPCRPARLRLLAPRPAGSRPGTQPDVERRESAATAPARTSSGRTSFIPWPGRRAFTARRLPSGAVS
jgi:hypothetical protein